MRLNRKFYQQDAYSLAKSLLGKVICIKINDQWKKYRIVETESYGGATDRASHAYGFKKTKRKMPMYLDGGHIYIYLIYGMYYMFNISASKEDNPEAVLIRGVDPLEFNETKSQTNGPGKLCRAMQIDKRYNEIDLVTSDIIFIEDNGYEVLDIVYRKRINIDYAKDDKDHLWRFYIKDNRHVSKK